jgi:hypothetical protein
MNKDMSVNMNWPALQQAYAVLEADKAVEGVSYLRVHAVRLLMERQHCSRSQAYRLINGLISHRMVELRPRTLVGIYVKQPKATPPDKPTHVEQPEEEAQ